MNFFKSVKPGTKFRWRSVEMLRLSNGNWASDNSGRPWMMSPSDIVEIPVELVKDEDEDEINFPFNMILP